MAAVISEHSRPGTWVYQEKPWLLLSAKNLSAISPAKSGRLGSIYFWEVDPGFPKCETNRSPGQPVLFIPSDRFSENI